MTYKEYKDDYYKSIAQGILFPKHYFNTIIDKTIKDIKDIVTLLESKKK